MKLNYLHFLILFVLFSCDTTEKKNLEIAATNFYTQGIHNRTAAEWEPALGTLIVWPLSIPHKLVIELAKDNHLFTMVEDKEAQKEAEKWFGAWSIDLNKVTFMYAEQGVDAWWTRDWGPSAVFTDKGSYKLADGKYIYATPLTDMACNDSLQFLYFDENKKMELTQIDDDATIPLAKQLGFELMDLPFNNTGGNVLTDGLGTAFSTCVIYAENKYHGIDAENFLKLNDSLLGFQRYNIISNFEKRGIQHIDCLLKLIDEETILVAEPPEDHELFSVYNDIIEKELSKFKTAYGNPYTIKRIKTARWINERLAAYTNSLILNKTVYIPLFDIPQDAIALATWRDVMPGYTIKGFTYALDDEPFVTDEVKNHYRVYGWNDGDALHCRTRAIWNPDILFISVNTSNTEVDADQNHNVYATIIDYSKKGLVEDSSELYWRIQGDTVWKTIILSNTKNEHHFFAEIPNQKSGTTIEYYISAVSKSGEKATRPITAPLASYTRVVK
ncbi:agmatine deiminase family protein [Rasiella sp. SM2506]|uniref:agmatine deiminase family protein n=1 Tax=Rasiella sp. SM2506 TaxID=3423914 RepID=UPI003D79E31F